MQLGDDVAAVDDGDAFQGVDGGFQPSHVLAMLIEVFEWSGRLGHCLVGQSG